MPYQRWGFYPGLDDEFPFVLRKELKTINPINTLRYYNTNRQGIKGLERFPLLGDPRTWIPFTDKLFYPHRSKR